MQIKKTNIYGFTLIELLMAMAIALIVMGSIYRVYQTQQRAFTTQQLVVEMQQNARSAIALMKREIRMAGYKPAASDGIDNGGPPTLIDDADPAENGRKGGQEIGVVEARTDRMTFRMDIWPDDPAECTDGLENGGFPGVDDPAECYDGLADDPEEEITYELQANAAGDGNDLVRITSTGTSILAYDIEAIALGYAYDENEDGLLDTDAGGNIIWAYDDDGDGDLDTDAETGAVVTGPNLIGGNGPLIGAVRIWLLARTPQPVRGEADSSTYQVGDLTIDPGMYDPAYKRTLQVATVYCRNLRF